MKKGIIYFLKSDNEVFYVGKTTISLKVALSRHLSNAKNNHYGGNKNKKDFINKSIKEGKQIIIIELHNCEIDELGFEEKFYIQYFKFLGFNLINNKLIK